LWARWWTFGFLRHGVSYELPFEGCTSEKRISPVATPLYINCRALSKDTAATFLRMFHCYYLRVLSQVDE
jgi:hypothetical protein